jgi:hypothetical protein
MRTLILLTMLTLGYRAGAAAQQPDTIARRDSVARADSIAAADSIAIVRELERMGGAAARSDTATAYTGSVRGPINPRLLPDISTIGEVIGDFTPDSSTQESGRRIDIREVELAIGAAVDPYFRADVILGLNDLERISIEESYITAVALPGGLQGRLGRFHMPIGKQNTTHRGELQTIEYPYVIQRFLSPDAGKGTGLWLSEIFSPFGFYEELQLTGVDHFGEDEEGLVTRETANKRLSGLGFSARLRNYIDITEATNIEISGSAATGRRAQPITCGGLASCADFEGTPGVNARQSLAGADVTLRWKPLQQALYRSFILQAEWMRQLNERDPSLPIVPGTSVAYAGPSRDYDGVYVFARYQLAQRRFLGARFDWVQDLLYAGRTFRAASGYLQFFPTEFSKFVFEYEHTMPPAGEKSLNRFLFQSTFAVGPHRPHPF